MSAGHHAAETAPSGAGPTAAPPPPPPPPPGAASPPPPPPPPPPAAPPPTPVLRPTLPPVAPRTTSPTTTAPPGSAPSSPTPESVPAATTDLSVAAPGGAVAGDLGATEATAPARRSPRSPAVSTLVFRAKVAAICLAITGVVAGVQWYRDRDTPPRPEFPTTAESLPNPTSYWMSRSGRAENGETYSYRVQRSPGSDSLVMEVLTGFDGLDGATLLVAADGVWFFDRATGAVSEAPITAADAWTTVGPASELRTFSDVVPDEIRPFVELLDGSGPSDGVEPSGHTRVRYDLVVDLGAFREANSGRYERWLETMGLAFAGGTTDPGVDGSTGDSFRLALTVDGDGLVWVASLTQDGDPASFVSLDELSDTPFIPPDPTPVAPVAPAP